MRELVVSLLEELDYRVDGAGDGLEALAILDVTANVDLLLSDVVLPGGISGVQLSREVKRRRPEMRILLMSGYAPEVGREGRFSELGALFLEKPFRVDDLVNRLYDLLGDAAEDELP